MRERAAAILKVGSGLSMLQVALHGLHKPRRYETISEWISRYECGGVEGLWVQAGRVRKPAFSRCASPTRRRASHRWPDRNRAPEPRMPWPRAQALVTRGAASSRA